MPSPDNPVVVLAYAASIVLGLPTLHLVVKATVYITRATSKLEAVAESQERIEEEFRDFRHEQRNIGQAVEIALVLMQADINALQSHVSLPVRSYPQRTTSQERRREQ